VSAATQEWTVNCLGMTARDLLARRDFAGQVFAVVSVAVYLRAEAEIIWLACNEVKHRRAILGSFDLNALEIGMQLWRRGEGLQFDNGISLGWQGATVWHPTVMTPDQLAPQESVNMRVRQLMDAIQSGHLGSPLRDYGNSLAQAIPFIRAMMNGITLDARISNPLISAAIDPVVEMALACRDGNAMLAVRIGRALVGLGSGLTPSGDDFIGGLLFAAYHLKMAYPGTIAWDQKSIDDMLAWAQDRTNPISHAMLCDHANGQGVDALHNLLAALERDAGLDEVVAQARRLIAIGSTSGWDMLAGLMVGMLSISDAD